MKYDTTEVFYVEITEFPEDILIIEVRGGVAEVFGDPAKYILVDIEAGE